MATETQSSEPVVFLLPDGTEVSNDPRFYENKMREQIMAQQRELVLQSQKAAADEADEDTEEDDEDVEESQPQGYDAMTVEQLKEEATKKNVDLTGVKKKSELVQRLKDYDASQG